MKAHPATQFKGNYPEIRLKNLTSNDVIGKRSGLIIKSDNQTGLDFLLQDNLTVKSNCTTVGKKTQTCYLQESSDDSSLSSESISESLSSSCSDKGIKSAGNEQESNALSQNTHMNGTNINIDQIAEDLVCPTNYDNGGNELSRDSFNNSKISFTNSEQRLAESPSIYQQNFKTKEEIESRHRSNVNKYESGLGSNFKTIQGLSTIKKVSNSNNNSIIEENDIFNAELDGERKGKKSNKTIYEETDDDLYGDHNYHSGTSNNIGNIEEYSKKKSTRENRLIKAKYSDASNNTLSNDVQESLIESHLNSSKTDTDIVKEAKHLTKERSKDKGIVTQITDEKPNVIKRKHKQSEEREDESKCHNDKIIIQKKKKVPEGKQLISQTQYLKQSYQMTARFKREVYDINKLDKDSTFGINNRYSLRTRIPRLNHLLGEKIKYIRTENGDEVTQLISCRIHFNNYCNQYKITDKPSRLYKPLQELKEEYEEELFENHTVLTIHPHCQKNKAKNYQNPLICEIKQSKGNNWIIVNDNIYKNQKNGKKLLIPGDAVYEIRNYSNSELIVRLYVSG